MYTENDRFTVHNMTEGFLELQGVTDMAGSHVTLQPTNTEGSSREIPIRHLHNDNLQQLLSQNWISLTWENRQFKQYSGLFKNDQEQVFIYDLDCKAAQMAKATNRSFEYCRVVVYRQISDEDKRKLILLLFYPETKSIKIHNNVNEKSVESPNVSVTESTTETQTVLEQVEETVAPVAEDSTDTEATTTNKRRRRPS